MVKQNEKKLNLKKETLKDLTSEAADGVAGGGRVTYSCQTCYVNECFTTNRHICWWDK
ncbi:hypothetical protein [Geothrix sp. PMB-07]|uniref:hypothetical protein n=1 Tax=Geothrix sp. PMB-07 TaxID=3068640 RepID=UPI0027413680|nr:hypothetical protein [Geothrix sp. PMB-07]WLT29984.1 hypothetical protein Q9293_09680 [Geothrix sp. PMB-07]